MQTQSPLLQFSRVTAALILLLFGLVGLLGSRRGSAFDQSIQAEASESLDSQLLEREVMLDRRREAETLPMAFTRAQMSRHCWGAFAASSETWTASGASARDNCGEKWWRDSAVDHAQAWD